MGHGPQTDQLGERARSSDQERGEAVPVRIHEIAGQFSLPVPDLFFKSLYGGGQDQLLLGPGHGDIEDAEFFAHGVAADLFRDLLPTQGRCADPGNRVVVVDAGPPVSVIHHGAPGVMGPEAEALGQACHKADGKLQALALVDAHDADNIRVFVQCICLPVIDLLLFETVYIAQELKESGKIGLCEGIRLAAQKLQVGGPLGARRKGRAIVLIAGLLQKSAEELRDGPVAGPLPPFVDKSKEGPAFFQRSRPGIRGGGSGAEGVVKAPVPLQHPDRSDLILGKVPVKAAHGAIEGDVLARIVQDTQEAQHRPDLSGHEVSGPGLRVGGDPLPLKNGAQVFVPSLCRPQQDHDIPVAGRAQVSGLLIRDLKLSDQLPDPPRDHQGLLLPVCQVPDGVGQNAGILFFVQVFAGNVLRPAILRAGSVFRTTGPPGTLFSLLPRSRLQEQKFSPVGIRWILGPEKVLTGIYRALFQGRVFRVVNTADLPAHDPPEQGIDGIQDLPAAAEVLVQLDPLQLRVVRPVAVVFFHEDLGPGQAEAVDALLDIPDHKAVVFSVLLAGYDLQEELLHLIAVLIFVDQDLGVVAPQGLCRAPGPVAAVLLPFREDIQGQVLQVHKVDHMPVPFDLREPGMVFQGKLRQGPDRLPGRLHHGQDHLRRLPADLLPELLEPVLLGVPHSLNGVLELRVDIGIFFGLAADGGVSGKSALQGPQDLPPELPGQVRRQGLRVRSLPSLQEAADAAKKLVPLLL